jgi:hypothetical protein
MTPEMRHALKYYGMLDGDLDEAWDKTISAALHPNPNQGTEK